MNNAKEFSGIKFDGIQILRAISALMVALYHIDFIYNLKINTAIGVDIFFVISGFIIMYTTQSNLDNYAKKRIIKIVPLYWILTILTFGAAYIVDGIVPYRPNGIELLKSLFFIPYSRDAIRAIDVTRPIVGPAHTLLNEMFFYLVFWISAKINHKKRGQITCGILMILIFIGNFFDVSAYATLRVWTSIRMIDFIIGIILFYIAKKLFEYNSFNMTKNIAVSKILIALGIISFMVVFTKINPIIRAILSGIVVLFFLTAFFKSLKAPNVLLRIGNISYSFYLIHYYVILVFKKFVNPMNEINIISILCACLAIIISLVIANFAYEIIEVKFAHYLKDKWINKKKNEDLKEHEKITV